MLEIAQKGQEKPVSVSAIAPMIGISRSYYEQLAAYLRQRGIIRGYRGRLGGYRLAKPAYDISILDILLSVKTNTSESSGGQSNQSFEDPQGQDLWNQLERCHYLLLQHISLADVLNDDLNHHPLFKKIFTVLA